MGCSLWFLHAQPNQQSIQIRPNIFCAQEMVLVQLVPYSVVLWIPMKVSSSVPLVLKVYFDQIINHPQRYLFSHI